MQNVRVKVFLESGSSFTLSKVAGQHLYICSPVQTLLGQTQDHLGSVTLHLLGTFFQMLVLLSVLFL